jgi:hypothetical protein
MAQATLDQRQLRSVLRAYRLELPEESPPLKELADQAWALPPLEKIRGIESQLRFMPADHLHALLAELKALGGQGIDALWAEFAGTAIGEMIERDVALRIAGAPQESAKEAKERALMFAVRRAGIPDISPEEVREVFEEGIRTHLQMMGLRIEGSALSVEDEKKYERMLARAALPSSLYEGVWEKWEIEDDETSTNPNVGSPPTPESIQTDETMGAVPNPDIGSTLAPGPIQTDETMGAIPNPEVDSTLAPEQNQSSGNRVASPSPEADSALATELDRPNGARVVPPGSDASAPTTSVSSQDECSPQ